MRTKIVILVFLIATAAFSCRKKNKDEIQYVTVNFDISLTDPSFVDLNAVGGWVYVTGGVRGIIIYRLTQTDFLAWERNCPYTPDETCAKVYVDSTNVQAKDDCCGSIFSIINGSVLQSPASKPLKQYTTILTGTNLRVQN